METIREFGVQSTLLLAQGINFLILLFLLRSFLYKPIIRLLEERKQRIAKSMQETAEIEARLKKSQEEQAAIIKKAHRDADKIILEAKQAGKQQIAKAVDETKILVEKLIAQAKEDISQERQQMRDELRQELAGLVILASEKLLRRAITEADQKRLVEESVKEVASG